MENYINLPFRIELVGDSQILSTSCTNINSFAYSIPFV